MFTIKQAKPEDCSLIRLLASRVWQPTYGEILSPEQLNYMFEMMYSNESLLRQMTVDKHLFFIIYEEKNPVAYLSIETKEPTVFIFQKIYAVPEMQGKGIGRYMIEQGVEWLKRENPTPFTVMLYVNRTNRAVDFYKHIGFELVGERDHHIGNGYYMNDFIMEMQIR